MPESRDYYDGKYTVRKAADGSLEFLRHGEAWPAADNLKFNNLVGAMFREQLEADARIAELEASAAVMREALEEIAHAPEYDGRFCGDPSDCPNCVARASLQSTTAGTALLERMAALEAVARDAESLRYNERINEHSQLSAKARATLDQSLTKLSYSRVIPATLQVSAPKKKGKSHA